MVWALFSSNSHTHLSHSLNAQCNSQKRINTSSLFRDHDDLTPTEQSQKHPAALLAQLYTHNAADSALTNMSITNFLSPSHFLTPVLPSAAHVSISNASLKRLASYLQRPIKDYLTIFIQHHHHHWRPALLDEFCSMCHDSSSRHIFTCVALQWKKKRYF